MKKISTLFLLLPLVACSSVAPEYKYEIDYSYGVFLGADSSRINKVSLYDNPIIEIEEFTSEDISNLKENNKHIYAYLSVGSLENYRDYYEEFKHLAFYEYENWPDEKWVDVSDSSWQEHLIIEATKFKNLGAYGLFMDNFDVYYIASEEYDGGIAFANKIYNACIDILTSLHNLGLSLIINSGSTFLERLKEENKEELLDYIDLYTQECVFSNIVDYDHDKFSRQDEETKKYYLSVINMMKSYSDILLLEYTKSKNVIDDIIEYCQRESFHYYISKKVNLE